MFLDALDIHIMYLSAKLLYWYLRSYIVEKQVGSMFYYLKFSSILYRLHPGCNIIKLSAASKNPIFG